MDPEAKPETTSAAGGVTSMVPVEKLETVNAAAAGRVISKEPEEKPETTGTGGGVTSTEPVEKPPTTSARGGVGPPPPRLDCIKFFDALWFCYSPFHQMQYYYRYGDFDNCFGKWGDLVDCLSLKTKRKAEVEEILVAREKARPHIWTYRTVDEAKENWWRMYKHQVMMSKPSDSSAPPPESGGIS
ncbi:hypothetical protein ACQ4PT_068953 [Festuca glaucescens]